MPRTLLMCFFLWGFFKILSEAGWEQVFDRCLPSGGVFCFFLAFLGLSFGLVSAGVWGFNRKLDLRPFGFFFGCFIFLVPPWLVLGDASLWVMKIVHMCFGPEIVLTCIATIRYLFCFCLYFLPWLVLG
jgi:hypothetical protein